MNGHTRSTLARAELLTALLAISLPAYAAGAPAQLAAAGDGCAGGQQASGVHVWVINTARVDEDTLSNALNMAARIFRDAGIRLTWLRCPPGTALNLDSDSNLFILSIIRHPTRNAVSQEALGYSFIGQGRSVYADVFRDRVFSLAIWGGRCLEAVLLGHVIAHELGHLFLGLPGHSREGMMMNHWHASDLGRAAAGLIQFSPHEIALMRARLDQAIAAVPLHPLSDANRNALDLTPQPGGLVHGQTDEVAA